MLHSVHFLKIKIIDPKISSSHAASVAISFQLTFISSWCYFVFGSYFLDSSSFLLWHRSDRSMTTFLRRSPQLQNMINLLATRLVWYIPRPDEYDAVCLCQPFPFLFLSLVVHSFSLSCTATFPSQGQLLHVMCNSNYRSPFPLWRENKVKRFAKGSTTIGAGYRLKKMTMPVPIPVLLKWYRYH